MDALLERIDSVQLSIGWDGNAESIPESRHSRIKVYGPEEEVS